MTSTHPHLAVAGITGGRLDVTLYRDTDDALIVSFSIGSTSVDVAISNLADLELLLRIATRPTCSEAKR